MGKALVGKQADAKDAVVARRCATGSLAWLGLWLWAAAGVWAGFGGSAGWGQGLSGVVVQGELRDERGIGSGGAEVRLRSVATGHAVVTRVDRGGGFGFLGVAPGVYVGSVRLMFSPFWMGQVRVAVGMDDEQELSLRVSKGELLPAKSNWPGAGAGGLSGNAGTGVEDRGGSKSRVPHVGSGSQAVLRAALGASAGASATPLWEDREGASSAAREVMLAGGGSDQDAEEGQEAASAREEREAGSGTAAVPEVSSDGMPVMGSAPMVDGVAVGEGFRAGVARLGTGFAQGSVGQIRVTPRKFSAQTGGAAGGADRGATRGVEAGTRGGVHGSGFFQARESAWAAVNPFAVETRYSAVSGVEAALVRPADSALRFGGAVGRAVRLPKLGERWRLGLFAAAEGREQVQTVFATPETMGFYGLSTEQRTLLGNRGVHESEIAGALAYLSGLSGPEALRGAQWTGVGRVDVAPGRGDRVSLGYQGVRSRAPVTAGAQVADGVVSRAVGSVGTSSIGVDAVTVRWSHAWGPRWTNEVRGQVSRDLESEAPGAGNAAVPGIGPGGLAPQVSIAPEGFSYGTPATLGRVAYPDERRVEVADTSVWRFGRNLITVGGDWSRLDDRVLGATNAEGSFLYDSGTTGGKDGGLVDWISDYTYNVHAYPNGACPSVTASVHYFCFRSYSQSFVKEEVEFETHEVAGFAEDSMRLGAGLKATVGARWEYELLPFPVAPNVALDSTLAEVGTAGSPAFGTTATFPEDRNNVGPRVAVSWAPGTTRRGRAGWFTVQAGYGMYFGRLPGATLATAMTETGAVQATTRIRITPTTEVDCPQVANQGFGYPCAFSYAPLGVAAVAPTAGVTVFAKRFRLPVVQRGMFAVEREFGKRVTVRGEYASAWAVQLPETTDLNVAPSTSTVSYVVQGGNRWPGLWTGQSFQVPLYGARRTTKFGPVTAIESNANATYHAGTAEAVLRGWHGWGARGSFTFSRAIDYGPQVGATPRLDGQFDPFTDGYDKGRSSLDRPWGAAGALTYRSSWESGGEWARRVLGGWGMAAVGRAGSGAPYSYVIFGGTRLAGGHESVNGSGGATYLPTVGRNTLRLPMRSKVDLRASKELGLGMGRGWRLGVHADAFNALNTVSVSRVETRAFLTGTAGSVGGMTPLVFQDAAAVASEGVSTPAFGTALSSTTGLSRERTVEMGVRLSF